MFPADRADERGDFADENNGTLIDRIDLICRIKERCFPRIARMKGGISRMKDFHTDWTD